jgi:hypothetical protein
VGFLLLFKIKFFTGCVKYYNSQIFHLKISKQEIIGTHNIYEIGITMLKTKEKNLFWYSAMKLFKKQMSLMSPDKREWERDIKHF